MDGAAFNAIDGRVSALDMHMEYVRRDLGDIKADLAETKTGLQRVIRRLDELPTKDDLNTWRFQSRQDLNTWKLQWAGLGIGAVALTITGIIGGLGWLETRIEKATPVSAAPQPIIIQLPATPFPHR